MEVRIALEAVKQKPEAGMEECARWLRPFIDEVSLEFIDSGEPFWTVSQ